MRKQCGVHCENEQQGTSSTMTMEESEWRRSRFFFQTKCWKRTARPDHSQITQFNFQVIKTRTTYCHPVQSVRRQKSVDRRENAFRPTSFVRMARFKFLHHTLRTNHRSEARSADIRCLPTLRHVNPCVKRARTATAQKLLVLLLDIAWSASSRAERLLR